VLLSHDDRRFVPADHRARLGRVAGRVHGSVLADGFLTGTWRLDRGPGGDATLIVHHVRRLTKREAASLAAEGRRLLRFLAAEATDHEVRFMEVP
jgi:hypothetical protein